MKNILMIVAIGFTFGVTSCRDTPSEDSEEVEILETPEETTIEELQEEVDTMTVDSVETDTLDEERDSLAVEQ